MAKNIQELINTIAKADDLGKVRREMFQLHDLVHKDLFDKVYAEFKRFIPPRLIEELEEGIYNGWAKFFKVVRLYDETKSNKPIYWILRIVKNEIYNYFKILANQKVLNATIALPVWNDDNDEVTDIVFVDNKNPLGIMIANELDYLINFFFDNDDYLNKNLQAKEAIKLSYFEDIKGMEIAKQLNIGDSTVTKYKNMVKPRFEKFLKENGWDIN